MGQGVDVCKTIQRAWRLTIKTYVTMRVLCQSR